MTTPPKVARCAIYTRKSTEHNLDLEFNSLDAQREACEAYIKSQAHEGWRLVPAAYDDGGISGASLDRPALQALLSEIQAGKIDIVVVYKVDRLTRSLTDFAKLVELFDKHGVSFVSITQSFNTTTSMGRLTLNVLLSFAQFEREVIGERVRDKIAASKRKGLWMGGPVPLGYASVKKKLVIVEEDAETVRTIFRRYLELGSIQALAEDLADKGIVTKVRPSANNRAIGGVRFGVGPLAYLLKNRAYVGEVVHRGEIHAGDHQPILNRDLFEAVQARFASNTVDRSLRLKRSPSLLTGLIYDDRGNKMSPSHTNKQGVRYRYYVSHAVLQQRRSEIGSVGRVSAPDIEALVLEALRSKLGSDAGDDRTLIARHVERIAVKPNVLEIQQHSRDDQRDGKHSDDEKVVPILVPWTGPRRADAKGILRETDGDIPENDGSREALLTAIVKARLWLGEIVQGRVQTMAEIAQSENRADRYIRMLMSLAFVSPRLLDIIVGGRSRMPPLTTLVQSLPYSWSEQRSTFAPLKVVANWAEHV